MECESEKLLIYRNVDRKETCEQCSKFEADLCEFKKLHTLLITAVNGGQGFLEVLQVERCNFVFSLRLAVSELLN